MLPLNMLPFEITLQSDFKIWIARDQKFELHELNPSIRRINGFTAELASELSFKLASIRSIQCLSPIAIFVDANSGFLSGSDHFLIKIEFWTIVFRNIFIDSSTKMMASSSIRRQESTKVTVKHVVIFFSLLVLSKIAEFRNFRSTLSNCNIVVVSIVSKAQDSRPSSSATREVLH